jgi:hypothetical protein
MKKYKFKFNKKSLIVNIDPDLKFKNQTGWLSEALQAWDQIKKSSIFTDDDKKRILTLKASQIYKMLQPLK